MSTKPTVEQNGRARERLVALGKRTRALRERKGMTQEQFADRCGISVSFASLLERGERSPSYETLVQMADALGVGLADLFREGAVDERDEPYFGRLLEFARRVRLSRAQVERWVAVGQAMFALDARMSTKRDGETCSEEDCNKPVLAKNLCASHYHRARRARL